MKVRTSRVSFGIRGILILSLPMLLAVIALAALVDGSRAAAQPLSGLDPLPAAKLACFDRQWDQAERFARLAVGSTRRPAEARRVLGRILLARGRSAEARVEFEAAVEADPRDIEALRGLAAAHKPVGRPEFALLHLHKAIEAKKEDAELWKELGLLQRETGDVMGALASLQQSLALDPGQTDVSVLVTELATGRSGLASAPPRLPGGFRIDPLNPRPLLPEGPQHQRPGLPGTGIPRGGGIVR
jgi:Flp pilus assembly protein TadD